MDSSGKILLESAQAPDMRYGRLLITYRWLPKEPGTYRSSEADGIYDLMTRDYLLRADAATKIFLESQTALYSEHDSFRTVYDRQGRIAARFPLRPDRDIEKTYQQIEQQTGINLRSSQRLFGLRDALYARSIAGLIALRSDTSKPFILYDDYLQQGSGLVADDFAQAYRPQEFRTRIGGKWGLWRSRVTVSPRRGPLRPLQLLAPRYDSLRCFEHLCQVSAGGRSQWIDRSGKVLAGGKSFAYLQGPVVEGRLLSLAYRKDLSAPVSVVDSNGAIVGTLDLKAAGMLPYNNP